MEYRLLKKNPSAALFMLGKNSEDCLLLEMELTEAVDGTVLAYALEQAVRRFPLMGCSMTYRDGAFYYVHNERPMIVKDRTDCPIIGSEETNGHLLEVHYHGRMIGISFHHSLTDGAGLHRFLSTMCYYYFCALDQISYPADGIFVLDGAAHDEDWANPFETVLRDSEPSAEETGKQPDLPENCLTLPENNPAAEEYAKYRILLEAGMFQSFFVSMHTSPAIAGTLLMMRALRSLYPECDRPILTRLPVDLRTRLGCADTLINSVIMTSLVYDPGSLDGLDFTEQAEMLRNHLKENLKEESLKREAGRLAGVFGMIDAQKTLEQKRAIIQKGRPRTDVAFLLSYMNAFSTSGYGERIRILSSTEKEPFLKINIHTTKTTFSFDLLQSFPDSKYADALCSQMKQFGMSPKLEAVPFTEVKADLRWVFEQ